MFVRLWGRAGCDSVPLLNDPLVLNGTLKIELIFFHCFHPSPSAQTLRAQPISFLHYFKMLSKWVSVPSVRCETSLFDPTVTASHRSSTWSRKPKCILGSKLTSCSHLFLIAWWHRLVSEERIASMSACYVSMLGLRPMNQWIQDGCFYFQLKVVHWPFTRTRPCVSNNEHLDCCKSKAKVLHFTRTHL